MRAQARCIALPAYLLHARSLLHLFEGDLLAGLCFVPGRARRLLSRRLRYARHQRRGLPRFGQPLLLQRLRLGCRPLAGPARRNDALGSGSGCLWLGLLRLACHSRARARAARTRGFGVRLLLRLRLLLLQLLLLMRFALLVRFRVSIFHFRLLKQAVAPLLRGLSATPRLLLRCLGTHIIVLKEAVARLSGLASLIVVKEALPSRACGMAVGALVEDVIVLARARREEVLLPFAPGAKEVVIHPHPRALLGARGLVAARRGPAAAREIRVALAVRHPVAPPRCRSRDGRQHPGRGQSHSSLCSSQRVSASNHATGSAAGSRSPPHGRAQVRRALRPPRARPPHLPRPSGGSRRSAARRWPRTPGRPPPRRRARRAARHMPPAPPARQAPSMSSSSPARRAAAPAAQTPAPPRCCPPPPRHTRWMGVRTRPCHLTAQRLTRGPRSERDALA